MTRHVGTVFILIRLACGATAQVALEQARLPIAITHSRAHMVLTDLKSEDLAVS